MLNQLMPFLDIWFAFLICQQYRLFHKRLYKNIIHFLSPSGTCWPPSRRSACPQLVLGVPGLVLQVLWGHSGWPQPQCHPSRSQDQLDLQGRHEASRDAWPDRRRQELPWYRQGISFLADHWRIASCHLEEAQPSAPASQALSRCSVAGCWTICWLNSGRRQGFYAILLSGFGFTKCSIKLCLLHLTTDVKRKTILCCILYIYKMWLKSCYSL